MWQATQVVALASLSVIAVAARSRVVPESQVEQVAVAVAAAKDVAYRPTAHLVHPVVAVPLQVLQEASHEPLQTLLASFAARAALAVRVVPAEQVPEQAEPVAA